MAKRKKDILLLLACSSISRVFSPTVFSSSGLVGGGDEVGERLAL